MENPFFLLAPELLRLPMVFLATVATVIASQAVISGAYSVARQCMQLGFLPRMTVRHTSQTEEGQIYVPQVNAALAVGVLILVLAFKTSDNLAAAYGIAVTGTFLCTGVLAAVVFRRQFHWSRLAAGGVFGCFFVIDFAVLRRQPAEGAGGRLGAAGARRRADRADDVLEARPRPAAGALAAGQPAARLLPRPPAAVAHHPRARHGGVPDRQPRLRARRPAAQPQAQQGAARAGAVRDGGTTLDEPEAEPEQRAEVTELAPGIHRVLLRYGFMESPNIPRALDELRARGLPFDPMQASYFLGREMLVPAMVPKMPWWRLWLFLVMARNAVPATEFFRIPSDRVVELGVRVAI